MGWLSNTVNFVKEVKEKREDTRLVKEAAAAWHTRQQPAQQSTTKTGGASGGGSRSRLLCQSGETANQGRVCFE